MVAYSFNRRFTSDVEQLIKRQTIRADRKRHARVGEPVQLYFGMRTKHCRKLVDPDPVCTVVWPIKIWVPESPLIAAYALSIDPGESVYSGAGQMVDHDFAVRDGFNSSEDFSEFWRNSHGVGVFEGVLIKWKPTAEQSLEQMTREATCGMWTGSDAA